MKTPADESTLLSVSADLVDESLEARTADELGWLIRRGSPVHGFGVFALRDIPMMHAVVRCHGRIVLADQVQPGDYAMQCDHNAFLVDDDNSSMIDNYINHSCEPNIGFVTGKLILHALRPIEAGEELYWDYSTAMNEPGWMLTCGCSSPLCRRFIQSYCDLTTAQQAALEPICLNYLRQHAADWN